MGYTPPNPNGQATSANSQPMVLASDQSAIPVKNQDNSGAGIDSLSAGTGANGLMTAQGATNFFFSTVNSSTAQLTAGSTFNGTIEAVLSAPYASVIIDSDQPGTLTVKQYITSGAGTQIVSTPFSFLAKTGGNCFARSFAINGNYFSISVQNTGASTTTTLNINVAYGNIPGTTQLLNNPTSINEINGVAPSTPGKLDTIGTVVDLISSGTITTQNLVPAGVATAGSAVELALNGQGSGTLQVTGTYTGALSLQYTIDGTTWVTATDSSFISVTNASSATIVSASVGIWEVETRAYNKIRITGLAAMTGTATITLRASRSSAPALQNVRLFDFAGNGIQQLTTSDGTITNPTTNMGATVLNQLFNGTTWDRQRGMSVATVTGDTGAKTATGNGATQTNIGNKGMQVVISMGAVTGTTPTFVAKLQGSVDGGTSWYDIPGATTASLVATGIWGINVYPGSAVTAGTTITGTTAVASGTIPRTWRVVWTIGGTTPSFTITSITYNYLPN